MKSEHRHELKTNELSRILSEWRRSSEQYMHEHTSQLVVAAVVLIAIGIGLISWRIAAGSVDRQGWRALADATKAADYANVADKYAGTKVAAWARLREAEANQSSGIRLMFTDRDGGRSDLKKATESFEKLVADKSTPEDARERALFGLAVCREALPEKGATASKIDDRAIDAYQRLLNEFPETVYKEVAESRIAALRTGTAQDFYAWFDTQDPKPADFAMPKDLIPPEPVTQGKAAKAGADGTSPQKSAAAPAKKTESHPADGGPALPAPASAPASK